jgi:hypothetical protein
MMMRFHVEITTDNAAFHNEYGHHEPAIEVERILQWLGHRIPDVGDDQVLMDINGNRVGRAWWAA